MSILLYAGIGLVISGIALFFGAAWVACVLDSRTQHRDDLKWRQER